MTLLRTMMITEDGKKKQVGENVEYIDMVTKKWKMNGKGKTHSEV